MTNPYERIAAAGTDMSAHMQRLRDEVVRTNAQQVIELGVRSGVSTVALLTGLDETGGSLWSCDVGNIRVDDYVRKHPRWTFVPGDDCSDEVVAQAPPSCDVLFIDTSHTRPHTKRELDLYAPKVKPGGVIICHDTCDGGVIVPLWRFYRKHGRAFDDVPHSYGLGVVQL